MSTTSADKAATFQVTATSHPRLHTAFVLIAMDRGATCEVEDVFDVPIRWIGRTPLVEQDLGRMTGDEFVDFCFGECLGAVEQHAPHGLTIEMLAAFRRHWK